MKEWLQSDLASFAAFLAVLAVAALLVRSLFKGSAKKTDLHLVAFCVHCGWEGTVPKTRVQCGRCKSTQLSIVST